jgi:hypothetical protein
VCARVCVSFFNAPGFYCFHSCPLFFFFFAVCCIAFLLPILHSPFPVTCTYTFLSKHNIYTSLIRYATDKMIVPTPRSDLFLAAFPGITSKNMGDDKKDMFLTLGPITTPDEMFEFAQDFGFFDKFFTADVSRKLSEVSDDLFYGSAAVNKTLIWHQNAEFYDEENSQTESNRWYDGGVMEYSSFGLSDKKAEDLFEERSAPWKKKSTTTLLFSSVVNASNNLAARDRSYHHESELAYAEARLAAKQDAALNEVMENKNMVSSKRRMLMKKPINETSSRNMNHLRKLSESEGDLVGAPVVSNDYESKLNMFNKERSSAPPPPRIMFAVLAREDSLADVN